MAAWAISYKMNNRTHHTVVTVQQIIFQNRRKRQNRYTNKYMTVHFPSCGDKLVLWA